MNEATTFFGTDQAQKYMTQLCKHFGHKIEVSLSETEGTCRFSCGTATLHSQAEGLAITVSAADDGGLSETKSVIERHLLRFAFREEAEALVWVAR